jgi:hypothetical protein
VQIIHILSDGLALEILPGARCRSGHVR